MDKRTVIEEERKWLGEYFDNVVYSEYWADTMMSDFRYVFKDGTDAFYNLNSRDWTFINGVTQKRGVTCLPSKTPHDHRKL